METARMLTGCRALDLTNENGFLCGKILADLGFDVIKIEKPGGDPSRKVGPFCQDAGSPASPMLACWGGNGPDASLFWFAYNCDKRGITLDLETGEGRQIFEQLVKTADVVIETFRPGYLDSLGLGHAGLSRIKPDIILTSITPFGQNGPYRDYEACDLVLMGLAGELFLTGDSDRPPVNISLPQAGLHAGADAAVGTMIAYRHKKKTGEGQHVDVSLQQSAAWFLGPAIPIWELENTVLQRVGTFRSGSSRGGIQRQVWPCKDGYVFFFMMGGQQGAKTGRQLVKWIQDEGAYDSFLMTFQWETFDMATVTQETIDRLSRPILEFFQGHTKRQVLDAAMSRNISICPLFSMQDILTDPHLQGRGFWTELPNPALNRTIPYPRQFARSSENDLASRAPAPRVGEHNREVYAELGLSLAELGRLTKAGVI
jgi:crotonobetainyl-CoA:carnitine CoA-transferase CaiB-like acyl-CoA transferase